MCFYNIRKNCTQRTRADAGVRFNLKRNARGRNGSDTTARSRVLLANQTRYQRLKVLGGPSVGCGNVNQVWGLEAHQKRACAPVEVKRILKCWQGCQALQCDSCARTKYTKPRDTHLPPCSGCCLSCPPGISQATLLPLCGTRDQSPATRLSR